jgi:curli biogenesis system outer membrane secretion channel CsgG
MKPKLLLGAVAAILIAGCASSQQLGTGPTVVTGSSNTIGATGAAPELTHCVKPLGTAALVESENTSLAQYGVKSPVPLIRLMMQQSGCFVVVDRGQAMRNVMRERALSQSGELRADNNFGGGQMVAADFSVTPNVVFSQNNSKGMGAGLGLLTGMLPYGGLVGAVGLGGDIKFNEAQTTLALVDNRSAIQVAMAEGSSSNRDMSGVLGLVGGYSNTNADKVVAAGFLDAYNKMVTSTLAAGYSYKPQLAAALQPQALPIHHRNKPSVAMP